VAMWVERSGSVQCPARDRGVDAGGARVAGPPARSGASHPAGVPGFDHLGRESLTYLLAGRVVDMDTELLTEAQIQAMGAWARALHEAVASEVGVHGLELRTDVARHRRPGRRRPP
jgi:hypothetical protein